MDNPYQSPEVASSAEPAFSRSMFSRPSDWFGAGVVLAIAVAAGVFGFAGGVGELPWQQSFANSWQSVIWGVIVGLPSTLACYFISNLLTSQRSMLYATWAITSPIFPAAFSWGVIGAIAGC